MARSGVVHLNTLRDFEQFGIMTLTGEACNLGARILCDLTEAGKAAICECFGLPPNCQFKKNWNSGGVASIMMPYGVFQEIAPLILIFNGYEAVVRFKNGNCIGWKPEDIGLEYGSTIYEFVDKVKEIYGDKEIDRTFHKSSHPSVGLSNVHAWSGRVA